MSALFSAQDLLATTTQLLDLGVPRGVVRQRIRTGEWVRVAHNLVGLPAPMDWQRRLRAALLTAGAAALASHASAARLHRFDGYDRSEHVWLCSIGGVHVTSSVEATISRSRLVTPRHRLVLPSGLPVVSKPVALVQIAGRDGEDAAARALDGLLRDGVRPAWIRDISTELSGRGSSGSRTVLQLLHERVDQRLPRSWFQRIAQRMLAVHGVRLEDEWPVYDGERKLADLDLAWPALKIGIECQSWAWHATPAAKDRDNRRKRRLRALGWEILEVWWTDRDRIDEVVRDIEVEIERRRPSLPGIDGR